jgi:tetratricopeptide (TPR) repeat protein
MIWDATKRTLLAGVILASLPGTALSAGGGSPAPKSSTPAAAIPEKSMTAEQKEAAKKASAVELYDAGYAEIDKAAEAIDEAITLEAAGDEKSLAAASKARSTASKHAKKAIEKFTKSTELIPEYHEAWNMLGYSYRKTGQVGKAFEAYAVALKLQPEYEPAHEYLGEAHLVAGNVDKAREELEWLKARKSREAAALELAIQRHESGIKPGAAW